MRDPSTRGKRRKQNDLFCAGEFAWLNACVGLNGGPYDYADYAHGYVDATRRLIDSLNESNRGIDRLVYPIVFNFRHSIELFLKHLSQVLPRIWSESAPTNWTHKLRDNWLRVRAFLSRDASFDPEGDLIPSIEKIIDCFLEIDQNGEVFRYPDGKSGAHFLRDTSVINIDVLKRHLDRVTYIFDGWCSMACLMWDAQCEIYSAQM